MSRSVLVVSSSLLLTLASCAEEDASWFPPDAAAATDAGGAAGSSGARADTPVGIDAGGTARPDSGTRSDAGTGALTGLDAGIPSSPTVEREPNTGAAGGSTGGTSPGATTPGSTPPGASSGPVIADGTVRTDLTDQPAAGPDATRQPLIAPRSQQFDASSYTDWTYLDLESGGTGGPDLPGWDVALHRYDVQLNAGLTEVSLLDGASFDGVGRAPADGWTGDGPDGADENTDPDWFISTVSDEGAGSGWWSYDSTTHLLTAKPRVYAVRTVEGRYFKLAFGNYYNAAGASGYPTLLWGEVEAP